MWDMEGRKILQTANAKIKLKTQGMPNSKRLYIYMYGRKLKWSARLHEIALSSAVKSRIGFSHLCSLFFGFCMNLNKYILFLDGCVSAFWCGSSYWF